MNSPKSAHPSTGRPLSPHLQVWKWTPTMAMSILHRATGCALAVGLLMLIWWLAAAAGGAGTYSAFLDFATSPLGQFMLAGWLFAFYLHAGLGIRHLIMDLGFGLSVRAGDRSAAVIALSSILLTLATWACMKGWF